MSIKITTNDLRCRDGKPIFIYDGKKVKNKEGVKLLRENAGLTRIEFANTLGVSDRSVEGWELGRSVSTDALLKIYNIYGE